MLPCSSSSSTSGRLTATAVRSGSCKGAEQQKTTPAGVVEATTQNRVKGSVELFLGVGLDGAVGGGVGHTGQHETGFDLVIVQEALVGLIDGAAVILPAQVEQAPARQE